MTGPHHMGAQEAMTPDGGCSAVNHGSLGLLMLTEHHPVI